MKNISFVKANALVANLGRLIACLGLAVFSFENQGMADSGPWTGSLGFSSVQGVNQWYYQQRPQGATTPVTNLSWISAGGYSPPGTGYYQASGGDGWLYWTDTHPGATTDTIRKWVAPMSGNISITGRAYKIDVGGTGGAGGVNLSVEKNGTAIWGPKLIGSTDGIGYTTDADLGCVSVNSGDSMAFIADENGTFGFDQTGWDPTLTYSYSASGQFNSVQGHSQWYYQQRPKGGTSPVTNLTWVSGGYSPPGTGYYQASGGDGWLYWTDMHPGASTDIIRKWVAPSTGTVSITGRAYKIDVGGGGGVNVSIEKNGTQIWSHAIAYNDSTGYVMDSAGALTNISVSAGDSIALIADENGTFGFDQTGWDPIIIYSSSTPNTWNLHTDDTQLTLSIVGKSTGAQVSAITRLEDTNGGWNWTPSPITVPLLNKIYIGGIEYNPKWTYTTANVDTTSGTKVKLTFNSAAPWPAMQIDQTWWAHSGGGPVEVNSTITNNSGSAVTYNDGDIIATDLTVTSDADVTLWRFTRANSYNRNAGSDGSDSLFTTGTLKDAINSSTSIASTISNTVWTGPYVLGFTMMDVPSTNHGIYIGYFPDFGIFKTTTSGNAHEIRNTFFLWNSNSFTSQTTGSTQAINLPGIFIGTYKGDTDTGSNKMKHWFWANKITPTIKSNTNEPLVEYDISGAESTYLASSGAYFSPIVSSGVELVKEDADWGDDQTWPNYFGYDWSYNTTYWPHGMTLGSIVHSHSPLKLSLYMANTYNNTSLATDAGISSEEAALLTRFDGTATGWVPPGYDYWRGDMFIEADYDYLSHLGLMQVLDYMVSNRSGFRFEDCSAGGTKGKSFDMLQRASFMNTNDNGWGSPHSTEYYRMSFYSNSYMINPLQLQDQANGDPVINELQMVNYILRTGFLGGLLWGGGWSPYADPTYAALVPLFKAHQRPILRGADVYHILPMPDLTNWDGIEFFNSALAKGSVLLFKPNSSVGNMSSAIVLKGLIGTNTYSLTFQDRTSLNSSYTSVSGSSLMTTGIGALSGTTNDYDSEIIWINY